MKSRLALLALLAFAAPPFAAADPKTGDVTLQVTFNPTPNATWAPGENVTLSADARRNPALGQEDIFARVVLPGSYPRTAGQTSDFTLTGVRVGEKIIVQGYMCSVDSSDCYPSDKDNPPSCGVTVHILGNLRASCQPTFTWSGGSATGGVICTATCT